MPSKPRACAARAPNSAAPTWSCWCWTPANRKRARRPEHARDSLWISARTGLGLDELRARLRELAGAASAEAGGSFSARARHLEALDRGATLLAEAEAQLRSGQAELAAEELRRAQAAL